MYKISSFLFTILMLATTTAWAEPSVVFKNTGKPHVLTARQLSPANLKQIYIWALKHQNLQIIHELLPLYQQLPDRQALYVTYGQGLLAFSQQQYGTAQRDFQKIIDATQHAPVVQFYSAVSAMYDRDFMTAQRQLSSIKQLPSAYQQARQAILQRIQHDQRWQWSFNAGIFFDHNINHAPSQSRYGNWTFERPKNDWVITSNIGVSKTHYLPHHWFLSGGINAYIKEYRQEKKYSDFIGSLNTQLGWQNYHHQIVAPISVQRRWYSHKPYTLYFNEGLGYNYTWTPGMISGIAVDHGRMLYDQRSLRLHNHNDASVSLSQQYLWSPTLLTYARVKLRTEYGNRDRSDDLRGYSLFLAIMKVWQNGIKTTFSYRYQKDNYLGGDLLTHLHARRDNDHLFSLTVKYQKLQWHGFYPTLNLSYQEHNSNSYNNQYQLKNIFINIDHQF